MGDTTMKIDAAGMKARREARGWSQEHLADVAGLSARTVQRMEAEGNASHESRMAIASALGIPPAELLFNPPADAVPALAVSPRALSRSIESLCLMAALLVLALLYGGYSIGKDLALRDNALCAGQTGQCQR